MTCSNDILLLKNIDQMKKKMVETAFKIGFISQETIKCSQELDILLNLHMKSFSNNQKKII
ncbi:aspartyl-phosphate phosphatase Spo0E family protein [Bacillus sp. ISL-40]|uniref:aspartyl-phosphate phosphatase Spo0E family protein n=1 Tax=unclassified Bacillus (in: firmicutes) TaxID=185979 RepID=UPI001BE5301F|nr:MULTISPECIES: aspartyl-phosphate phosphatase Spo0E family protein [unclassified Bacillus (in: firmicutes)]MBT2696505.1 aspartyl-phosphate phosphatase Spo0E family protein [Bacillus sp. ISL-40]MBT2723011.1 aspartyl-phosphate phosphatase Spo0E family protein [Bacillus sp. ISL-46]MBT2743741.1 aspartyl-phosphate phosphatase Spo0E family protein [Bacillus sp. ISL-77]